MITEITGNGVHELNQPMGVTMRDRVAVYRDVDGTAANVELGFIDTQGNFAGFLAGEIASGSGVMAECGRGVRLAVNVTGFVSNFNIKVTS